MRLSDAVVALTIAGEAASEPYDCKVGIGNVIRNRQLDPARFMSDGTVIGTTLAHNQFNCWWNRTTRAWMDLLDDGDPATLECVNAWQESALRDAVDGATAYYATSIPAPSWATDDRFTIQIGKTRFYKL